MYSMQRRSKCMTAPGPAFFNAFSSEDGKGNALYNTYHSMLKQ